MATKPIDEEIRADFLTEAGELMQSLGEQLVALETNRTDRELLNAVFRAFHTVKGGAGFLQFTPMVELCHAAEDVFGQVRDGKRVVDSTLLDATLKALDAIEVMLARLGAGGDCGAAPLEVIRQLGEGAAPGGAQLAGAAAVAKPAAHAAAVIEAFASAGNEPITDDEFEALLDAVQGPAKPPVPPPPKLPPPELARVLPPAPVPGSAVSISPPAAETTLRIDTHRLDQMMNLVGELVLVRNRLKTLRTLEAPSAASARAVGELDHITRSLQDAVMRIRMQPIRKVFARFPKLARDVARGLGKEVQVELVGEDTDLDKSLVEALADPLVHMVRNSVDHGIEMPEVRAAAGKPAVGRLLLSAQQQGDHILITVRDDGAGIDAEKLRRKVVEKGLMDAAAAARLSSEECLQLVFMPGFSTKDQVSDLSGRGVGMDVVKSRITALNGSVSIESKLGQGSLVRLRVPLTLAILPALMVSVGARLLALPLADIHDVFALDGQRLRRLDRWDAVLYRNTTLRLVDLERWSGVEPLPEFVQRHVVVAEAEGERFGFIVGHVRAREEVVIKPLGLGLRGLAGLAGATVTGEGRVALIVDFAGLVNAYAASSGNRM